jgi:hypothetical protein
VLLVTLLRYCLLEALYGECQPALLALQLG